MTTPRYAADTSVSVEKSRAEIERTLIRYGATEFLSGWDSGRAALGFQMRGRRIRYILPLPDRDAPEFTRSAQGRSRSTEHAQREWEQACRQRWRALLLIIKAKLEAIEAGVTSFEDEFLASTLLPGGQTVSEHVQPAIAESYRLGRVSSLLALPSGE